MFTRFVRCALTSRERTIGCVSYVFRIRGHLGQTVLSAFPDLRAEPDGEDTVLGGAVLDQSAVHGVLARIESLGLELLEVRRVQDDTPAGTNR